MKLAYSQGIFFETCSVRTITVKFNLAQTHPSEKADL